MKTLTVDVYKRQEGGREREGGERERQTDRWAIRKNNRDRLTH